MRGGAKGVYRLPVYTQQSLVPSLHLYYPLKWGW